MSSNVLQMDVLAFLSAVQSEISDFDSLLEAIRRENQRAELYGQQHIAELMEVSDYQWQLEQVEMKLKAPSLIKITFVPEGEKHVVPQSYESKVEAVLLRLIMKIIRCDGQLKKEQALE